MCWLYATWPEDGCISHVGDYLSQLVSGISQTPWLGCDTPRAAQEPHAVRRTFRPNVDNLRSGQMRGKCKTASDVIHMRFPQAYPPSTGSAAVAHLTTRLFGTDIPQLRRGMSVPNIPHSRGKAA